MALVCVARDPGSRLRDIADCIGITERAAHRIVSELVEEGYLTRERQGNRNRYEVQPDMPMRHPLLQDHWIGELLAVLVTHVSERSNGQPGKPEQPSSAAAGSLDP